MVVYYVHWTRDTQLSHGSTKGRPKSDDYNFSFTVLCRSSADAVSCLAILFRDHFKDQFSVGDGVITLKRVVLDSRNFTAHYMFMDGINNPICLSDLKESLSRMKLRC